MLHSSKGGHAVLARLLVDTTALYGCAPGACYTDSNNQAQCGTPGGNSGQWQFSTKTWVETVGLVTYTSVTSYYVSAAAQATATCSGTQSPCGSICCDSGYYCKSSSPAQCAAIGGGTSGGIYPSSPLTPSAPLRPTNLRSRYSYLYGHADSNRALSKHPFLQVLLVACSKLRSITAFPVVQLPALSLALFLLSSSFCSSVSSVAQEPSLIPFWPSSVLERERRHTHEETYIEERRHSAGGAALAAGGGRWYGQSRPARPASEKKSGVGKGLGMAAALGGLALALGLKRRHDKKDDKSTVVSGSSYYYSDYTSEST